MYYWDAPPNAIIGFAEWTSPGCFDGVAHMMSAQNTKWWERLPSPNCFARLAQPMKKITTSSKHERTGPHAVYITREMARCASKCWVGFAEFGTSPNRWSCSNDVCAICTRHKMVRAPPNFVVGLAGVQASPSFFDRLAQPMTKISTSSKHERSRPHAVYTAHKMVRCASKCCSWCRRIWNVP